MTSPFSAESTQNGVFTKFVSILVMALVTIGAGFVAAYGLLNGNLALAEGASTFLLSGIVFFTKAAGISDGVSASTSSISQLLPQVTTAITAVANSSAQNTNLLAQNTAAVQANTAVTAAAVAKKDGGV